MEEELLEAMEHRVRAESEKVKQRKCIVERPFGTVKRSMNQGYFLMRGLNKVRAERSLTMLAYNHKRVTHILGVLKMVEALA